MGNEHIQIEESSRPRGHFYRTFRDLPKKIYRSSPYFVPWLNYDMKSILTRRHPLFEHTDALFLLARRGKRAVGRIMIFDNSRYNRTHETRAAHFFFLDLENDMEILESLFNRASDWARERKLDIILGPMGFGGVTGGGILVEGFEERCAMNMMGYNHPYYPDLMERYGFEKFLDLHSFYLSVPDFKLPEQIHVAARALLDKGDFGVKVFHSKKDMWMIAPRIIELYKETLGHHPENYLMSESELQLLAKDIITTADPELIKILTYHDKVIGFLFAFHDLSRALRKSRGRLTPLSIVRIIREYKKTDRVLINGIGILPEYQGLGGNALLYSELEKTIKGKGFRHAEMILVAETTARMLSNVETLKGESLKVHRIFQLKL